MNELATKLSNLGYEIVGTLLPGALASVALSLWLVAMGPLLPAWSGGVLPAVHLSDTLALVDNLSTMNSFKLAGAVMAWYLLGYVLSWGSRGSQPTTLTDMTTARLIKGAMCFQPLRPQTNYDDTLGATYAQVCDALQRPDTVSSASAPLPWALFFQVVRPFILQRLGSYSLITTHQLKYTFYRSMTTLSAILCWLSLIGLTLGFLLSTHTTGYPHFLALTALTLGSVCMSWGFAESYAYSWRMFGNAIVTEAFAVFVLSKRVSEAEKTQP